MTSEFNLSLLSAPIVTGFQGRQAEISALDHAANDPSCSILAIVGMGGVGKSWLARSFVDRAPETATRTVWLSLLNAPSWTETLINIVTAADPSVTTDVGNPQQALSLLHQVMENSRCFLVLDNFESLMEIADRSVGSLRAEHSGYEQLLRLLAMQQSWFTILTSRERPAVMETLGDGARTLALGGLAPEEAELLQARQPLVGTNDEWHQVVNLYGGNPQLLKLAAGSIHALGGSIEEFLRSRRGQMEGEYDLFDWHFQRLSHREQSTMYWLAALRQQVNLSEVARLFHPRLGTEEPSELALLTSLRNREIVDWAPPNRMSLQPAMLDFVTSKLVSRVGSELIDGDLSQDDLLNQQALLLAVSPAAVRSSVRQLVLDPVLSRLTDVIGPRMAVREHLVTRLSEIRDRPRVRRGYAAGNLLNLLVRLEGDLAGIDLSELTIRGADLSNTSLVNSTFAGSDLIDCEISQTFGNVLTVAASSDGEWFAAGGTDNDVRVWSARAGEQHAILSGHTNWIRALEFDRSGTRLASASSDGTLRLWDVQDGRLIRVVEAHDMRIWGIAWSDDIVVTASQDHTLRAWSADDGRLIGTLAGHRARVLDVGALPGSRTVVSCSADHTVRLWDLDQSLELDAFDVGDEAVSVAVSPRADQIAVGLVSGQVQILRLEDRRLMAATILDLASSAANSVVFDPRRQLVLSAHDDGSVLVWDSESGGLVTRLSGHTSRVTALAVGSETSLVTGGEDRTVRLWETSRWEMSNVLVGRANHAWSVDLAEDPASLRTTPSGTLLSSHEDGVVRVWRTASDGHWSLVDDLRGHSNRIWSVRASRSLPLAVTASEDGFARIWDTQALRQVAMTADHLTAVWSADFTSTAAEVATGGDDGHVRIWETMTGRLVHDISGHSGRVRSVACHPVEPLAVSGAEDFDIKVWSTETGELVRVMRGHTDRINALSFNEDGTVLVSGSRDGTVSVWSFDTSERLAVIDVGQYVWAVAAHPTSPVVAVGTELGEILRARWPTESEAESLSVLPHRVKSLRFSIDAKKLLACSEDGLVQVLDLATGAADAKLYAPRAYEGLDISGVTGLTTAAVTTMEALGATISSDSGGRSSLKDPAMLRRAFLSYARHDAVYVERLADFLDAHGVPVWFDREGVSHGSAFADTVEAALSDCGAVIAIMSTASSESRWVKRELQFAETIGKPVLPLLLEGSAFFQLGDLHFEDVRGGRLPSDQYIARLLAVLGSS